MTLTNRRHMLLAGAAVVGGVTLAGCPSTTTPPAQILSQVIDAIQAAVAEACGFVPSVATLLSILAMFPGIGGVATIAGTLLTEVSTFLCAAYQAQGGPAAAIAGKPMTMTLKNAVAVPIHGLVFNPSTGKFVQF